VSQSLVALLEKPRGPFGPPRSTPEQLEAALKRARKQSRKVPEEPVTRVTRKAIAAAPPPEEPPAEERPKETIEELRALLRRYEGPRATE
jgi:hypothetical protein